jgi:hypothetical protein
VTDRIFEYFRHHANSRGLVLASETRLSRELHASHDALVHGIKSLEAEGRIEVLAPLPYAMLAFKTRPWPGSNPPRVQEEQQISSNPERVHSEVPVSSRAAAATQQEDGGLGEGEALLEQVISTLGPEADRGEFRQILAGHQPALIHRCLRRVQATKAIRVSRAALFRSLLQKLSH